MNSFDFPWEVAIELTLKCNRQCDFCFNKNSEKTGNELDTISIIKIMEKIKNAGIEAVRFTGGEPTLREDIFFLIDYAKSTELYTILNTNANLIDQTNIGRLVNLDELIVSLNFLDDSFLKKKIENVRILKENIGNISFCTVATKDNLKNIGKFYEIVDDLGVGWILKRPIPSKSFLESMDEKDVEALVDYLLKINQNGQFMISNAIPFCACDPEKMEKVSRGRWIDVNKRIVVGVDGHAKPSYYFSEDLGDVLKKDLMDCWNHDFARKLRNLELINEACKKCKFLEKCGGGSRFAANLVNGSYYSLDPLAQPEKFKEKLF